MRLWFAPGSEIPLYRQLGTQIVLAILAGELQPGEKLPSTRALARRYGIHPNTVSAAYQALSNEQWLEARHGSGMYVRGRGAAAQTPEQVLDVHIAGFFRAVRELGLPMSTVREQVARWLHAAEPDHFLLIEADAALRKILATELRAMTRVPVQDLAPDACSANADCLSGAIPLCRPSRKRAVEEALPVGTELVTLPINSVPSWMGPVVEAARAGALLAVVSGWPTFLDTAKTMLLAAGVPGDALLFCDTASAGWTRGLDAAEAILCDAYTATLRGLPPRARKHVFPLLAADTAEVLDSRMSRGAGSSVAGS